MTRCFQILMVLAVTMPVLVQGASVAAVNDSLYVVARDRAHNGSYDAAIEMLDILLTADSTHIDALLLYGQVHLWKNDPLRATAILERVVTNAPGYRDAWIALAAAYDRAGKHADACSSSIRGLQHIPADSLLGEKQRAYCRSVPASAPGDPASGASIIEVYTAIGGTFFESLYGRDPWGTGECGIDIRLGRWGGQANIRAQRRKYGALVFEGAEFEMAPCWMVVPKSALTARFSASPYSLFDTLFPSYAANLEVNAGLPGRIEIDGAARFRWYGKILSPSYVAGFGKYLGRLLVSGRVFMAPIAATAYVSGAGELRIYSRKQERSFAALGVSLGRSPYDAGAFTANGYMSSLETIVKARRSIAKNVDCQPSLAFSGEQITRRADADGNGTIELQRSPVRMRSSLLVTLFFRKDR